jgi:hypothetical protein
MSSYQSRTERADDMLGVGVLNPDTKVWQESIAEKIFSETGDPKLKSMWDFKSLVWNTGLIDKMYNLLKTKQWLPGADRALAISANCGVSVETAASFLNNLSEYVGKDVKAGPVAGLETLVAQAAEAVGDLFKGTGSTTRTLPIIVLILAGGVAAYLAFAGRKGVKLTPF